jgi:hypothetical protein
MRRPLSRPSPNTMPSGSYPGVPMAKPATVVGGLAKGGATADDRDGSHSGPYRGCP